MPSVQCSNGATPSGGRRRFSQSVRNHDQHKQRALGESRGPVDCPRGAQAGFEVNTEASDFEQERATHWPRIHRKCEVWLKDPDDVFLDAPERDEQRKKRGLPPGIIVLPWSAEEEEKLLAARRAQAARKRKAKRKR